jgi:hypothetical protein
MERPGRREISRRLCSCSMLVPPRNANAYYLLCGRDTFLEVHVTFVHRSTREICREEREIGWQGSEFSSCFQRSGGIFPGLVAGNFFDLSRESFCLCRETANPSRGGVSLLAGRKSPSEPFSNRRKFADLWIFPDKNKHDQRKLGSPIAIRIPRAI